MTFAISFTSDFETDGELFGKITIQGFSETFSSYIGFWARHEYERQWREGLARLVAGAESSCLLTDVDRPENSDFFIWWPMYRRGSEIIFQNGLLFLDRFPKPFLFAQLYDYVAPMVSCSADGEAISQWHATIGEIEAFLR